MALRPPIILVLGLCLGQLTSSQRGVWTKPSLQAEPGPVVPHGQRVTLVCQSPVGKVPFFRLEKEGATYSEKKTPSGATEARFLIQAVSEASAGSYSCIYSRHGRWSHRSEALQLVVMVDDVPPPPSGLSPEHIIILAVVSGASLLLLSLLLLLLLHRRHQQVKGSHGHAGKERLQERFCPTADIRVEAGVVTVEGLSEQDSVKPPSPPAAGAPQEVTYAQLDHHRLAQRAAPAGSPQPPETKAQSSMYADLAWRLCLGQLTSSQRGVWTKPSLQAEPGPVVPHGQRVTLVCQSPVGKVPFFRLEKEGATYSEKKTPSGATEARFLIQAVSEASAGSYSCIYSRHGRWSHRSEALQLVVMVDDVPPPPSGDTQTHAESTSPSALPGDTQTHTESGHHQSLSPEHIIILAVVSGASLLLLSLLLLLLLHRRHQKMKGGSQGNRGKERLQERFCPMADVPVEAGVVTVDRLSEQDRVQPPSNTHPPGVSQAPDAGAPQEVTYAQLNHHRLAQRAAPAGSPQPPETKAQSCTYTALAWH
ncbi:leukocyte-associated immunoglobulin-like receptor 1 [Erinaceus europaeus]|uniref:Leukocyte-associated immunoglobulin-like receptor 1 n=1 Tax=Erinaceus europaeus TaxID=9365 RepID=A0ABM3X0Y6_ERIEU|nr:leukocyte-associated immunoglobulin-like receptor 1 [Erinaceus europaeus]